MSLGSQTTNKMVHSTGRCCMHGIVVCLHGKCLYGSFERRDNVGDLSIRGIDGIEVPSICQINTNECNVGVPHPEQGAESKSAMWALDEIQLSAQIKLGVRNGQGLTWS